MSDTTTTQIAMTDPALTSQLGMPENQYGVDYIPLIAPEVQVHNRYFKARVFGKDRFKGQVKISRPRGGDAERVYRSFADPKSFSVEEKTLKDVIDRRDLEEARNAPDGGFDLRSQTALDIAGSLRTSIRAGIADMFLTAANYPTGSKAAIGTTMSGTATLSTIRAAQKVILKKWGVLASTLILTSEAWDEAVANTTIRDQIKYVTKETLSEEMLAQYLGVSRVIVPLDVQISDADEGSFIWAGKKAVLFYSNPAPGLLGPCFAKTFYRNINGVREEARSGFDMPGNEHIYVAREEETALVFADAGYLWY